MGQSPSKISTHGRGESTLSECLAGILCGNRSAVDEFSQQEEEEHYYPHALIFQGTDPKADKLSTRLFFRRPLTLNNLKLFKHRPSSLVGAVWRYIEPTGPNLSDIQKEAIMRWKEIDILNSTNPYQLSPIENVLEKYFHIFDDLFFRGALKNHVILIISTTCAATIPGCKGHTSEDSNVVFQRAKNGQLQCRFNPISTITIYINEKLEPMSGKVLKGLFGVLVHEMCHAFFYIYGCVGNCCRDGSLDLGTRGHGIMFQEITFNIQIMAASESVLGCNLNMGRYFSLLQELRDKQGWKEQMDVSRWGFDEKKLINDLVKINT
ncbi:730e182c-5cea-4ebb-9b80-1091c2f04903-CDS [Sclerotinia trifoliorum]|uniref:730e182c-5cea-4ebb-9b80-1091c2f04903-CDS n=1 Tax=Sclerotinia trifoliorum TaxID=28548 RepID=A0A8H2W124_9HELO|nr:730e182c-5cea-4ebb-9b80-1091c2f04903-CDS [Sclerotinia trifoliorum]